MSYKVWYSYGWREHVHYFGSEILARNLYDNAVRDKCPAKLYKQINDEWREIE